MAVFFLFVDGLGIGENHPDNPLAHHSCKTFSAFTASNGLHKQCKQREADGILYIPVDANLDVEGLPQSGTGQVSLFTGVNASKMIGKHFGPYPFTKTRPLLKNKSLFHKIQALGVTPHFINAYPDVFFQRSNKRNRWTSTTMMAKAAGLRLNTIEDVRAGRAVTAEITQTAWRDLLNLDVPEITPETGAKRVLSAMDCFGLVLFEYYLTDKAGHEMNREKADSVLSVLDRFMDTIMSRMKDSDTFVICSDHGNVEDLTIKTHTRNPVPLLVKGNTAPFKECRSITDVTPAIVRLFEEEQKTGR